MIEKIYELGLDNSIVDWSFVYRDVKLKTAPRLQCDVIKTALKNGEKPSILSIGYESGIYTGSFNQLFYIEASECVSGYRQFLSALIFYDKKMVLLLVHQICIFQMCRISFHRSHSTCTNEDG